MAYVTLGGHGQAEVIVKKSRFIVNAAPAKSADEAWAFVERIRLEHKDATHNVFAFKTGQTQRLSDDGEPSGTAGRPAFDVLEKQGLSDSVIVVTRYFGGILLGAGGLVRAYSQAAVAGVEAAGTVTGMVAVDLAIRLDYTLIGKVQYLLQQHGALVLNSEFAHEVIMECRVLAPVVTSLESELAEASAGRIRVEHLQKIQVGADLRPLG